MRQRVSLLVLLPMYVLHCYLLKSSDFVADCVVVSLEQRLFYLELPCDLADHNLGVAFSSYLASSHVVRQVQFDKKSLILY